VRSIYLVLCTKSASVTRKDSSSVVVVAAVVTVLEVWWTARTDLTRKCCERNGLVRE
jgi:hypothetical protein